MAWQAMAGPSPVQSDAGQVVTTCRIQNVALGIGPLTVDVPNDGTVAGLTAAVKAMIAVRSQSTGQRNVVPSGTVLDLSDPPPPAGPTQADINRSQWGTDYATYRRYMQGVALGLGGYDAATQQTLLTQLQSAWVANDPTYDALLVGR